ncbi:hard surface induced protein [Colletotrichum truncatum]|uniref:Hard surface induced protein n=1 Tax=Colletotrichum truncatum TaxID=5467 RepID=A0ACC3Z4J6_COLTU|nr:hard surface induced protein [Colletotrichum truncatum]KAF6788549.1 hard surface induced protein [Colletotrichum truncatum]
MAVFQDNDMAESQGRPAPAYTETPVDTTFEQLDLNNAEYEKVPLRMGEDIPPDDEASSCDGENLQVQAIPPRPLPPWIKYPKAFLLALVPSFLHPSDPNKPPKPLHPTSWLDGLRGVAAFLVVCHHWSLLTFTNRIHAGYGADAQPLFIQLPIIRLVVSGFWAVCVFFVISGFALSYKPLKLLKQKRVVDFAIAAASSAFRRYIRIFGPPMVTTFIIALMTYCGWFEKQSQPLFVGFPRLRPPVGQTLSDQLWHWFLTTLAFADPLSRDIHRGNTYPYDAVLWTIPIEFDSSLVVFLAHVAFSRLRPCIRLFFDAFACAYTLYFARWEFFLFLSGMFCADIHFYFQSEVEELQDAEGNWDTLPLWSKPWRRDSFARIQTRIQSVFSSSPAFSIFKKALTIFSFFVALWLLSYPHLTQDAAITPGFSFLHSITPPQHTDGSALWIPVGAVLLVFTVDRAPLLQRLFTNRFAQYLGRISYALYLVHNSLLWVYGWHLVWFFTTLTGIMTDGQYGFGIFLATSLFFPGVILVADFAQRYLDAKIVAFAAWFERKLIAKTK